MSVIVSVIVPVYNESKYIDRCVRSLLMQDYLRNSMEWIFVDGGSTDGTLQNLEDYQRQYPDLIVIKDNPYRTAPYAMNIGIRASKGKYILRMDAHEEYRADYISRCIYHLENTDADNVGGVAETKGEGFVGRCIAKVMSSRFGVGNSAFRTNGKSGYVDTVPFGAFRREVFSKYGMYDERLTRNQDNEINYRIRKNGGKIYLADDIRFTYYCRDSVKGLEKMAKQNGKWNVITMKLCPGSMMPRHFVPLAFVLSIIILGIGGFFFRPLWWLLAIEAFIYLILDILYSAKCADSLKSFFMIMLLFPVFHISYGIGSIQGIFRLLSGEYRNAAYSAPKL